MAQTNVQAFSGDVEISSNLAVSGNLNATGSLAQGGQKIYPERRWEVDLSSGTSTSNFYPLYLETEAYDANIGPFMFPVSFRVVGDSLSGADSFNEETLVGYARGGGASDHVGMCKVHSRRYQADEFRCLGIWEGTNNQLGIVIYLRGGYKYSLITDATDVVVNKSSYSKDNSTWAVKNASKTDVVGTSVGIGELQDVSAFVQVGEVSSFTGSLILPDSTARLGIGKTNPGSALDVVGTVTATNGTFSGTGPVIACTGSDPGDIISKRYSSANRYGMGQYSDGVTRLFTSTTHAPASIRLSGATNDVQTAGAGFNDYMTVKINGNVGIGTTIPLHALDVRKDVTTGSLTTTNLQTQFKIGNSTFTAGNALMGYSGRASHIINAATYWKGTGGYYGTTGYFGIAVNNNSTGVSDPYGITDGELESQTHLVIKHNGNVGIGTVIPLTTLDVNGPMQSYMGRHVKTVPVRHNAYSDIAGNGGTVRLGNQVVGGGAGYNGSLATGSWFGSNAIGNFSADRWVTPNRMRVCFKWGFVAGYYSTVTFKIWETLYTSGDSLKATFTSGNGSLSRGLTTVWGPDMTMVYGDVPGLMIEADSNASGNAGATIRISDIWLEYVYV